MTIQQIIIKRTGMSAEDAAYYEAIAAARVRAYLHISDEHADLSAYMYAIANIAVLYWQMDNAIKQGAQSIGYQSESWSEGGVSHSVSSKDGSTLTASYEAAIRNELAAMNGGSGVVRFL